MLSSQRLWPSSWSDAVAFILSTPAVAQARAPCRKVLVRISESRFLSRSPERFGACVRHVPVGGSLVRGCQPDRTLQSGLPRDAGSMGGAPALMPSSRALPPASVDVFLPPINKTESVHPAIGPDQPLLAHVMDAFVVSSS